MGYYQGRDMLRDLTTLPRSPKNHQTGFPNVEETGPHSEAQTQWATDSISELQSPMSPATYLEYVNQGRRPQLQNTSNTSNNQPQNSKERHRLSRHAHQTFASTFAPVNITSSPYYKRKDPTSDEDDTIVSSIVNLDHHRYHEKSFIDMTHLEASPLFAINELFITLEEFKIYMSSINRVHRRLIKHDLSEDLVNYETMLKSISAWTTSEHALVIAKFLWKHFEIPDVHVTAFRASILFWFSNDGRSWPIIEWREGNDKEFLALFHFDEKSQCPGVCNWLLHCGTGILADTIDGARWSETSIAWSVVDISHLKTLFGVAQHFLGILEWAPEIALKLYCAIGPTTCSQEEMNHYAKLLHIHVRRIELLEIEFDKVAPIFLKLSHKADRFEDDGTSYAILFGRCWLVKSSLDESMIRCFRY